MSFSFAQELQRVGVPGPLAKEIQTQELSGVGNVNRLIWSGVPVGLAKAMAAMFTARTVDADKLVYHGLPYPVVMVIAREIDGFPSFTGGTLISGNNTIGSTLTGTGPAWSGNPTPSVVNIWQTSPDGVEGWENIQGASGATYLLTVDEFTKFVRFGQIGTNQVGSDEAFSDPFGPIYVGTGGL